MERIRRTDCEIETIYGGGERVRGIPIGVPMALRLRAALNVVKETTLHPLSASLITVDPQKNAITVVREPNC